eukprot:5410207-Lingulodinium_polyedra.AAC.1
MIAIITIIIIITIAQAPPERKLSVCIGGSSLSSFSTFQQMWMTWTRCGGGSMQIHADPCAINPNPYKSMQIDYPVAVPPLAPQELI